MRITASKLYIIGNCPAAGALPAVREEVGDAARHGTAVHAFLDAVGRAADRDAARVEALDAMDPEHREACAALDLTTLPLGEEWLHEVGFALNVRTREVTFLGEGLSHDAIAGEDDAEVIAGVVDLVGTGTVLDWKTGWRRLPPAVDSEQLAWAAVCKAKLAHLDEVKVGHVFLRKGQKPWTDFGTLAAFDLAAWEERLIEAHTRAMNARDDLALGKPLQYAMGEWCRYCPAKLHCEAQTKLIRAMANKPVTLEAMVKEKLTEATAAQAIARLEILDEAVKRAWAALYAYAGEHPIALPDGRVLGPTTKRKRKWVVEKAAKVLAQTVGADLALSAFDLKPSVERIGKVAKAYMEGHGAEAQKLLPPPEEGKKPRKLSMAAVKDALLALIDAAGGREWEEKSDVDFYRPGADESDE